MPQYTSENSSSIREMSTLSLGLCFMWTINYPTRSLKLLPAATPGHILTHWLLHACSLVGLMWYILTPMRSDAVISTSIQ